MMRFYQHHFLKIKLIIINEVTDKFKNEIEFLKEKKLEEIKIICISNILEKNLN